MHVAVHSELISFVNRHSWLQERKQQCPQLAGMRVAAARISCIETGVPRIILLCGVNHDQRLPIVDSQPADLPCNHLRHTCRFPGTVSARPGKAFRHGFFDIRRRNMCHPVNRKSARPQISHCDGSWNELPVLHMLRVEHLAQQLFAVFDNTRRDAGSSTDGLIEVRWRNRHRNQTISASMSLISEGGAATAARFS